MKVNGQLHTLGKEPAVPIGQEAGWAQEPVLTQRREKNPCPCQELKPNHPAHSIGTILTELPGETEEIDKNISEDS
jgi:hypothetical protein